MCTVLDEVTSALSEESEEFFYTKMQDLGITFMSIGHRSTLKKVWLATQVNIISVLLIYFLFGLETVSPSSSTYSQRPYLDYGGYRGITHVKLNFLITSKVKFH